MSSDAFWKYLSAEAVEESFKIAYFIALAKKSHNIEKALMKPCMLKAVNAVIEEVNRIELLKISLSDYSGNTH